MSEGKGRFIMLLVEQIIDLRAGALSGETSSRKHARRNAETSGCGSAGVEPSCGRNKVPTKNEWASDSTALTTPSSSDPTISNLLDRRVG